MEDNSSSPVRGGRVLFWAANHAWMVTALLCSLLYLVACTPTPASVVMKDGAIVASGWHGAEPADGDWSSVLSVRASEDASAPPLLGDYTREGDRIVFTPRFKPAAGVTLNATFQPGGGAAAVTASFGERAKAIVASARVTAIHPTADAWPANTLRMYVTFSAPMKVGQAYTHIRIRDAAGGVIEKPFVEIGEELWDPSFTRLTLLFDPGRIKRGLVDNETAGPPLVPGRRVTIEVDAGYLDAQGAPLVESFRQPVRVSDAQRKALRPEAWTLTPPPGPTAPLIVRFDRAMDDALARRAIRVMQGERAVGGGATLGDGEREWAFMPASPWTSGAYTLEVDGILEDIAGNRPGKPFDVDLKAGDSDTATKVTRLPFTVALPR